MPWYHEIADNGLYEQVGDYSLLYQFVIWIMTLFPAVPNLFAFKIFSCLFDYVAAVTAGLIVYRIDKGDRCWNSVLAYALVLIAPTVFINSSAWAQCDAIYVALALLGVYLLDKGKYNTSLIMLGLAFSFKLHTFFVLPVFLFYYFAKRQFSILRFLIVPATIVVTSLPLLFWGRSPFETFVIYSKQTSAWPSLANGYPSIWLLMFQSGDKNQYDYIAPLAILITIGVLAFFMVSWLRKKYMPTGKNLIIMTFLLSYTCVFFLPAMHERYGFLYEICAIILAILIPKTIPLAGLLMVISMSTYASYLFYAPANYEMLVWFNIFAYLAYIYVLRNELLGEEKQ
jgi:Gpi18-like mannosyltransferase